MVLDRINNENDIKQLNSEELKALAREIRGFLIRKVSKTGGHLASNLGVVELTMALHLTYNLPKDKIIWDVGHQAYVHKILTGRWKDFDTLRQYGGLSGFPKRRENSADAFDTGHSSNSISVGLGFAEAAKLKGTDEKIAVVVGDGSMTGGMVFEALNNAGNLKRNLVIILNDNHMSISKNVGGFSKYLSALRTADFYTGLKKSVTGFLEKLPNVGDPLIEQIRKAKSGMKQLFIPGMFFEDMGITYLGPVSGHNLPRLCRVLREAQKMDEPVLIHVVTKKGRGYLPAEQSPEVFHGIGSFEIKDGKPILKETGDSWSKVFGRCLCRLAKEDDKIVALTAAMAEGTGLRQFRANFPDRFFDVGIAEAHAVSFAAGLAAGGEKPVFAVYSSFLQRGFDQLIQDVALQELPVVFAVDRAGLVGSDGETHQGIFDLSYMGAIPNINILAPKNRWELEDMLKVAIKSGKSVAIRYPRGVALTNLEKFNSPVELGKSEMIYEESDIALISVGHMIEEAEIVRNKLKEKGFYCTLVNARSVKPLDIDMLERLSKKHRLVVTIEENVKSGGYGEAVLAAIAERHLQLETLIIATPDSFVEQGSIEKLRAHLGIDAEAISKKIFKTILELWDDKSNEEAS
ncbi:MAG: 1-deoxy-D-xylulose-5-phosphate synthase [Lachnospiraceae bacterium]|jgi:1-deoxy-D-xylulose-5-phosphate synthase|nr:1-deoxy-D-xylulose-5-phosphate synthase [Lachnospiraceae bacterium]